MSEISLYLKEGEQTLFTPEIVKLASSIKGNSLKKLKEILSFLESFKYSGFNKKLFRKRTASQIIADGFITGCTDSTLVFITIARACGLPAKYVETVSKDWLRKGNDNSIQGHQYAQVWVKEEKKWIWVDSMKGKINSPSPNKNGRKVYKVGLDSWDIGITDFKSLKSQFLTLKSKYTQL